MRVLSVKQPFTSLIITGKKRFEVRSRATPYRGLIAIHASSSPVSHFVDDSRLDADLSEAVVELGWATDKDIKALTRSAVIGVCELVAVHDAYDAWPKASERDRNIAGALDRPQKGEAYWWEMRNPLAIDPVPCLGKLNLWELDPKTAAIVEQRAKSGVPPERQKVSATAVKKAREALDEYLADLNRPMQPSAELAVIVGKKALPRVEVTKRVWSYIQKHSLQDTKDPSQIRMDSALQAVTGSKGAVSLFELVKHTASHLDDVD